MQFFWYVTMLGLVTSVSSSQFSKHCLCDQGAVWCSEIRREHANNNYYGLDGGTPQAAQTLCHPLEQAVPPNSSHEDGISPNESS